MTHNVFKMTFAAVSAVMLLSACGGEDEPETIAEPDFSAEIAEDIQALESGRPEPVPGDWDQTTRSEAIPLFRAMCSSQDIDRAQCECLETQIQSRLGNDALLAIAATFSGRTDLATTVAERLTPAESAEAAMMFQSVNRQCRARIEEQN